MPRFTFQGLHTHVVSEINISHPRKREKNYICIVRAICREKNIVIYPKYHCYVSIKAGWGQRCG